MSKTVSILMPTRSTQPGDIRRALTSLRDTASNYAAVEVLLRIDDDDAARLSEMTELEERFAARCVVGPRGIGYLNMGRFVDDVAALATGRWSWLFDDDAWVQGPWQAQLEAMSCDENGPAVNAEFYELGKSRYSNWPKCGPAGLIMPTPTIKQLRHTSPVDDQWLSVAVQRKWQIRLLKGVVYFHDGRAR